MKNILLLGGGVVLGILLCAIILVLLLAGNFWNSGNPENSADGAAVGALPSHIECTETDEGKDIMHAGTTSKGSNTFNDTCLDENYVSEYFCLDREIEMERMSCRSIGAEGCNAGQCVMSQCTETDGGNDPANAGSATYRGETKIDRCIDARRTLEEYYCTGFGLGTERIDCTESSELCWNAECSPTTCQDSDGGENADIFGSVNQTTENGYFGYWDDRCGGDYMVLEHFCENGFAKTSEITCPSGMYCLDGRCRPETCYDTDGGNEPDEKGYVTKGPITYEDNCDSSNDMLTEYYCVGNEVRHAEYYCPGMAGCGIGKCWGF